MLWEYILIVKKGWSSIFLNPDNIINLQLCEHICQDNTGHITNYEINVKTWFHSWFETFAKGITFFSPKLPHWPTYFFPINTRKYYLWYYCFETWKTLIMKNITNLIWLVIRNFYKGFHCFRPYMPHWTTTISHSKSKKINFDDWIETWTILIMVIHYKAYLISELQFLRRDTPVSGSNSHIVWCFFGFRTHGAWLRW